MSKEYHYNYKGRIPAMNLWKVTVYTFPLPISIMIYCLATSKISDGNRTKDVLYISTCSSSKPESAILRISVPTTTTTTSSWDRTRGRFPPRLGSWTTIIYGIRGCGVPSLQPTISGLYPSQLRYIFKFFSSTFGFEGNILDWKHRWTHHSSSPEMTQHSPKNHNFTN